MLLHLCKPMAAVLVLVYWKDHSLPLLRVLRNLHCMLSVCEQAGWQVSSAVCVCAPHVSILSSFPFSPSLPRPSLQFTDQLLSRMHCWHCCTPSLGRWAGRGGWLSSGVCSSSGTHAHMHTTHTLLPVALP